jgi:hypothetical protein
VVVVVVVYFPQVCSGAEVNSVRANDVDKSYKAELVMTKSPALSLTSPFRIESPWIYDEIEYE